MKDSEKTKEQLLWELKKLRQQSAQEIKARDLEIDHLNQVIATVNSTLDLNLVVEKVLAALKESFRFNQISIFLFNSEKNALEVSNWFGDGVTDELMAKFNDYPLPIEWDDVYFVRSFLDNEAHYVYPITPRLLTYYGARDRQMFEWNPHKAIAIVPLQVQEKVIGVINFVHTDESFELSQPQRARLERYVAQIAATINNAYLVRKTKFALQEAQNREREISHINQIIQAANSTLDFDEVFKVILSGLKEVFEFNAIGIQLVNDEQSLLNIYRVYGEDIHTQYLHQWQAIQITTARHDSISSSVFCTGEPAYFPIVSADLPFTAIDRRIFQICSFTAYLAYPLIVQGKTIGVISFFCTGPHFELKEQKLAKIQRYVTSISTTIDNAKKYQELKTSENIFRALLENHSSGR